MIHYILAGTEAVDFFYQKNWQKLQSAILMENKGEIYSFDYFENNAFSELLNQLNGWHKFIELSKTDIKSIEINTLIEFEKHEQEPQKTIIDTWNFVEKYFPNYSSSDEILRNNELSKAIEEGQEDLEHQMNDSNAYVYGKAIEGYLNSLTEIEN